MVDIVTDSRREEVQTQTQQDMRRALEFIEEDIKNASYIYTGDQIQTKRGDRKAIKDHFDINENYNLVLAFWKPQTFPYSRNGGQIPSDCSDDRISDDTSQEDCEILQIEKRTDSLVVYLQDGNPNDKWEGKSLLRRFVLRKYADDETFTDNDQEYLTLALSDGYIDPTNKASGFRNWPYDNEVNLQDNAIKIDKDDKENTSVLVDFVDDPSNNPGNLNDCSEEGYSRTPEESTSFFACVRTAEFQGDFSQGNQDVVIYLRGNPDGRSGYSMSSNSPTPLPTLQTQVMLRGVVDKFIDQ